MIWAKLRTVFKVYMKSNVDMLKKAAQYIESAPAEAFNKLLTVACPQTIIPTDEVYFIDKNNKRHEMSYNARVTGADDVFLDTPSCPSRQEEINVPSLAKSS